LVDAPDGRSHPARGASARRGQDRRGAAAMKWQTIETENGTRCRVREGRAGAPLVFFHGAGGLRRDNPFLDQLAQGHHVFAPEWPGYGEATGQEALGEMLEFTPH